MNAVDQRVCKFCRTVLTVTVTNQQPLGLIAGFVDEPCHTGGGICTGCVVDDQLICRIAPHGALLGGDQLIAA